MYTILSNWKFWAIFIVVIIIIVIIIIFWLTRTRSQPKKSKKSKKHKKVVIESSLSSSSSCEEETINFSPPKKKVHERKYRYQPPVNRVKSSVDAVPRISDYEMLENLDDVDMTPKLPDHIQSDIIEKPRKQSKGEAECKRVLEKIYGIPFKVQVRPSWLINYTGYRLELDLYNEEYGIACEYNGEQHYKYVPKFHKNNIQEFEKQVRRDNIKIDLCDLHNVYLITVPYNVKIEKIEAYIKYYLPEAVAARQARKDQLEMIED